MDMPFLTDQQRCTYISTVQIQDSAKETYQKRWVDRDGERVREVYNRTSEKFVRHGE